MPPAHPFVPLRPLRLAIATGNDLQIIAKIFDYIWRDGLSVEDDHDWYAFTSRLGIADPEERLNQQQVKDALRAGTEEAIAAGVFGVPTLSESAVEDTLVLVTQQEDRPQLLHSDEQE